MVLAFEADGPTTGTDRVYLAGGHVAASLDHAPDEYQCDDVVSNSLPPDARDTTGVLLSTEAETLLIAGKTQAIAQEN